MPATISSLNRSARSHALLLVVCLAQFMVILDVAIVNVALPSIHDGLGFSDAGLQWVVNAYTLTFAGFLMLGGRAADLLGRRRILLIGTGAFAVASALCAVVTSPGMLVAARAIQGLAGAIVSPATLSIITTSFAEGPERNRALSAWVTMGSLGASSGALLGGVLTQSIGWQAIFAINFPLGIVAIALGLRVIPAVRPAEGTRHFDVTGAMLVTAGLTALTYGIVRSDQLGWGSTGVLVPLLAGIGLLAAFLRVEGHHASQPLVPLSIFRIGQLRAANLIVILMYGAFFAMWYFVTLYLQQVQGHDALTTGLEFLPMTGSVFLGSRIAPRMVNRFGVRPTILTGLVSGAVGLVILAQAATDSAFAAVVLPGGVLASLGMGTALVPATIASVQGVPASQSGLASGLLNTSRLAGGALGLAVLSTIATSHTGHLRASGFGLDAAMTGGFDLAFKIGAALCLTAAAVAIAMLKRPQGAPAPVAEIVPAAEREAELEALAA